jgi:prepilin-type N-terminal cleavage/methylation domain-containing protein
MLKSEKGVSLVEIMVALAIFGIGVVAAIRTLPESNAKTTRGRNVTISVNLAQEKLEELMGLSFSDADLDPGTHSDPGNPLRGVYNRSWVVTDATPIDEMKMVSVSVSYETASADSVKTLRTYISSRQ